MLCPYEEYNGSLPRCIPAGRRATETLIRRLTLDKKRYPNVFQISGLVTGVQADPDKPKYLKQVVIQNSETGAKENIDAMLVVGKVFMNHEPIMSLIVYLDCTGPTRGGMKWLPQAGFRQSQSLEDLTVSYDPQMRYASFKYKLPKDFVNKIPEEVKAAAGLFVYRGEASYSQTLMGASKLESDFSKWLL